MHTSFALLGLAALAAAAPAPAPQALDFAQVSAAPTATAVTVPISGTGQTITIEPSAVASSVGVAAVTATAIAARDLTQEDFTKRDGTCLAQIAGTGPAVNSPDTPAAFLAYKPFQRAAYSASVPSGWSSSFSNLQNATTTSSYMGYTTLTSYSPSQCATLCEAIDGCQGINVYYERDPTLDANAISCPNPTSLTNIKCSFWGVPVSPETAVNAGQWRDSFEVVISGSNGYNIIPSPPSCDGYVGPTPFNGALNAPVDPITHRSTYIGSKFFSFGTGINQIQTFDPTVCTSACTAQTAYDYAHSTSKFPSVCNQVVAYILNNAFLPQGIYCAMYNEEWHSLHATVTGYGSGWTVGNAYSYVNSTYAATYDPICSVNGCSKNSYKGGNCGGWGRGAY